MDAWPWAILQGNPLWTQQVSGHSWAFKGTAKRKFFIEPCRANSTHPPHWMIVWKYSVDPNVHNIGPIRSNWYVYILNYLLRKITLQKLDVWLVQEVLHNHGRVLSSSYRLGAQVLKLLFLCSPFCRKARGEQFHLSRSLHANTAVAMPASCINYHGLLQSATILYSGITVTWIWCAKPLHRGTVSRAFVRYRTKHSGCLTRLKIPWN